MSQIIGEILEAATKHLNANESIALIFLWDWVNKHSPRLVRVTYRPI